MYELNMYFGFDMTHAHQSILCQQDFGKQRQTYVPQNMISLRVILKNPKVFEIQQNLV